MNFLMNFIKLHFNFSHMFMFCCSYSSFISKKMSSSYTFILSILVRSGNSFEIWNVNNKDGKTAASRQFKPIFKETKGARAMTYSENYFAVGNAEGIRVYDTKSEEMKIMWSAPHKKSYVLKFSPKQGYLVVYEIYTSSKDTPDAENLFIYVATTGELKMKFTMKKHSEWEPFFSHDDSFFAILINGEVNFYENFVKAPHKLSGKLGGFSISPGSIPHVAIYLRGEKGSPSMTRLFKYPNLDTNPVASKSFSQADRVTMHWNKKGTGCLIMTSTDVDSTGASYYGKQSLHFLATNGDSYSVPLAADGPVHDVQWSPKSNQFIVVFGNSPAKATLFNLKCDSVFDFGTGIRNSIYFNDFGNLVLFGGFGNLRGNVEVWDLNKKKQVSTSVAVDTTVSNL
jgi:translation initiation factor 2A